MKKYAEIFELEILRKKYPHAVWAEEDLYKSGKCVLRCISGKNANAEDVWFVFDFPKENRMKLVHSYNFETFLNNSELILNGYGKYGFLDLLKNHTNKIILSFYDFKIVLPNPDPKKISLDQSFLNKFNYENLERKD